LEGTFSGHLAQPPCSEQGHLQLDQAASLADPPEEKQPFQKAELQPTAPALVLCDPCPKDEA